MARVIATFGRFNPPTRGHAHLIEKMLEEGLRTNTPVRVYMSRKKGKKNPLHYEQKFELLRSVYGNVILPAAYKSPIEMFKGLNTTFSELIVYVGSDEFQDFTRMLSAYNKVEFDYDWAVVRSSGQRTGNGIETVSATQVRQDLKEGIVKDLLPGLSGEQVRSIVDSVVSCD